MLDNLLQPQKGLKWWWWLQQWGPYNYSIAQVRHILFMHISALTFILKPSYRGLSHFPHSISLYEVRDNVNSCICSMHPSYSNMLHHYSIFRVLSRVIIPLFSTFFSPIIVCILRNEDPIDFIEVSTLSIKK